ncbi:SCO family protein [Candidatus Methylomirabilis sp.]|uniref:SCO family protein n=1 Tax=Candidatus Methylomirabilis sp. TaxID=2032687 RepID=UPI002A674A42|nr:SCO family protein [Candidatus Methylomirabilis sp.]
MRQSLFSLILIPLLAASAFAQPELPEENRYVFRKMPNALIKTAHEEIHLSEIYTRNPVLLTFVYTRCPTICYPYLQYLQKELQKIQIDGYRVLVLNLDPRDTVEDMVRLGKILDVPRPDNWMFGVTKDIAALADSMGFHFEWRKEIGGFDHPAMVAGIDRNGYVLRILVGFQKTARLAEVLREMQGEFIPSYPLPGKETIFRCFEYDPITGKWRMGPGFLILFTPALLGLFGLLSMSLIIKPSTGGKRR